MVVVYTAQNVTDAHLIKNLLEQEGIPALVVGGDLQGGIGELPVLGLITVKVRDDLAERAARLIADFENAEPVYDPDEKE
ncbi:putative signal transducing protein [Thiogranum longum]